MPARRPSRDDNLPVYAGAAEFVNADDIAGDLAPGRPELAAIRAGRSLLERTRALAGKRATFDFETTLAGRAHGALLGDLKDLGSFVHLTVLWLPNPDLAIARVRERVASGGHEVPESVVRRRFARGLDNFRQRYRALADAWLVFDNALDRPPELAELRAREQEILDAHYGRV